MTKILVDKTIEELDVVREDMVDFDYDAGGDTPFTVIYDKGAIAIAIAYVRMDMKTSIEGGVIVTRSNDIMILDIFKGEGYTKELLEEALEAIYQGEEYIGLALSTITDPYEEVVSFFNRKEKVKKIYDDDTIVWFEEE